MPSSSRGENVALEALSAVSAFQHLADDSCEGFPFKNKERGEDQTRVRKGYLHFSNKRLAFF